MQYITLNNGVKMPLVGFGVYQIKANECEKAVKEAIDVGYRLIDTAQAYYNEEGVGSAVVNSGVPRDKLFITTKVWISNAGDDKALKSIDESLRKLKTDYIDLLLIHQPFGDCYGTYRAMQKAYKQGKVRAIGLSNFYDARFIDLCENLEIKPAVVQLETHVFTQQRKMTELMAQYKTKLMAWSPLAEGKNNLFTDKTLKAIGSKYGKTNAQIALKFLAQKSIVSIPKTVHKERMIENLDIFDFNLDKEDLKRLDALDTGKPLAADFTDPKLAKFLLDYDKTFNPANS